MQILLKEMFFCWGEDTMKVIFNLYFFATFQLFLLSYCQTQKSMKTKYIFGVVLF